MIAPLPMARRSVTRRSGIALAATLAAGLVSSPVQAEDAAPAAAPWKLSVTPYAWATSLHGKAGVAGKTADVDVSFDDLFKHLEGALMLDLELRKGRFALMSNSVYAKLEDNSSDLQGRVKVDATANMLIQGLAATYRVGTWQLAEFDRAGPLSVAVDPYAGIRYTYLDTELKGKLDLPDLGVNAKRTADSDKNWVDPIIGLRTIWTLGDRLNLIAAGDIGGTSRTPTTAGRRSASSATASGCSGPTTPIWSPATGPCTRSTRTATGATSSSGTSPSTALWWA